MWKVVLVDPRKTVAGPNIRPRNDRHIWDIAKSMNSIGQIEECVGEMFLGKVRIWAGIHRRNSGILICRRWNPKFLLRVRVSAKPLTPEQIIAIQLAENLQAPFHIWVLELTLFHVFINQTDHYTSLYTFLS